MQFWAVKNDCNGIFEDTISRSRSEAASKVESVGAADCYVVPCVVMEVRDKPDLLDLRRLLGLLDDGPLYDFIGWGTP